MENGLEFTEWFKNGSMMVRRTALPLSHPESVPSLWLDKFGDLVDFPWEDVYGEEPTMRELISAGFMRCPTCGHPLRGD